MTDSPLAFWQQQLECWLEQHHAADDGAIVEQRVDFAVGESGQELAALVEHAGRVGHQDQFFRLQRLRQIEELL